MKKPLGELTLDLDALQNTRREAGDYVLSTMEKLLEPLFGVSVPEGTSELLSATMLGVGMRFGAKYVDPISKFLARPLERLARPQKLMSSVGSTVLVRDAGRYDLVEVLVKAQAALGTTRVRLIPPHILFDEAFYNYEFKGTLIEFQFVTGVSRMVPEYVCLHPDPTYNPPKPDGISEFRVGKVKRKP